MNIDEIKKISLVEFLNQLGYQPTGRDSKGLWFYAPYRSERKPSFHVNPNRQVWFDFGTGAGGDIFSLAGEMSGETDFLRQAFSGHRQTSVDEFLRFSRKCGIDGT